MKPILTAALFLYAGCTLIPLEELEGTTLYFPPTFKYISEPRYSFSKKEKALALHALKEIDADTLLEVIIDPRGKVEKIKILRTQVRKEYRENVLNHAKHFGFTPDPESDLFRTFYFPMKYRYESEFEWFED